jgi:hypothetical protein
MPCAPRSPAVADLRIEIPVGAWLVAAACILLGAPAALSWLLLGIAIGATRVPGWTLWTWRPHGG